MITTALTLLPLLAPASPLAGGATNVTAPLVVEGPTVEWQAPTSFVAGGSYVVNIQVTAPDSGTTVSGWMFTPGAFTVNGKALAPREDKGTITLPKGAKIELPIDIGPLLADMESGFSLGYATDIASSGPIEVRILKPAPKGLNFMEIPVEELSKYNVLIQTNQGDMLAEFWPDVAPMHVRNFLDLSYTGFYAGTTFHRVIPGFMIQGGDQTGTGSGNGPRMLNAEFSKKNHERGVLSMARTNNPNSASCQFFVMHANSPHLDGQYSAFGKLLAGFEVLDAIATTPTQRDRPVDEQRILKAVVIMADANWSALDSGGRGREAHGAFPRPSSVAPRVHEPARIAVSPLPSHARCLRARAAPHGFLEQQKEDD